MDVRPIYHQEALRVITLNDFLLLNLPPRKILLSPWLSQAGLAMIHAYRGVGKTHMALNIAYSVASGKKFLNWNAPEAYGVLYIDGEMPATTLQERLMNIVKMNGEDIIPENLKIITPDLQASGMPDLATQEGQEMINKYLEQNREIRLVILDNISCLAPSIKENDAHAWAPMQTWLLYLRSKGISVLIIHHSGKGGKQRGTSKKEDVLDTVIFLEHPEDYESNQGARFVVHYEKNRGFFGNDAAPFECQLVESDNKYHWVSKPFDGTNFQQVIKLTNEGYKQFEIAKQLSIHRGTVSKYVTRAKEEGRIICED